MIQLVPYKNNFRVTSPQMASRTVMGVTAPHNGMDMVGTDKNIYAVKSGIVVVSSIITDQNNPAWQFGNRVMIRDADNKYAMYNHLSLRKVSQGQQVIAGQIIGIEGSSGRSTGSHLHFEVRDRQGAGYSVLSAAEYLGIPNAVGMITVVPNPEYTLDDVFETIADKADFDLPSNAITAMKTLQHKFPKDFWQKILKAMK
ncbi:MAG: M23 family metallopeptidase [Eubacteriales bacterium]